MFAVHRVHDHLLSLASPLVPDESGSSGGKTPIVAPPPTFASGNKLNQCLIQRKVGRRQVVGKVVLLLIIVFPYISQQLYSQ